MPFRPTVVLAALLAAATLADEASAQAWPAKPIRVIIPWGAGSAVDVIPRIALEELSRQLGQPIVVETRPGAGGTIGSGLVAKAEPDGYTLLVNSSAHTITPSVYQSLAFDPARDLAPVIPLGNLPQVMIVAPAKGYRTVEQLVAAAKAKPGSFNFTSTGVGAATHLSAERFRLSAGFEAAHVVFKSGAEALTEIVSGRVDYYFCPIGTALPFIADQRVLGLAVSTPQRASALPEVRTTLEAGYANSDYTFWMGMFAPAKTPREIVDRLHAETAKALSSAGVKQRFQQNGVEPLPMSPAEFAARIADEIKSNAALVKLLNLKPG